MHTKLEDNVSGSARDGAANGDQSTDIEVRSKQSDAMMVGLPRALLRALLNFHDRPMQDHLRLNFQIERRQLSKAVGNLLCLQDFLVPVRVCHTKSTDPQTLIAANSPRRSSQKCDVILVLCRILHWYL